MIVDTQPLADALSQAYYAKVENEIRLQIRQPKRMPRWLFRWLMRHVVIEETPLRFSLEAAAAKDQESSERLQGTPGGVQDLGEREQGMG